MSSGIWHKLLACGIVLLLPSVLAAQAQTVRMSVSSAGEQGNGPSTPSWRQIGISENGRHVVYISLASNLIPNDVSGGCNDIFAHDRDPDENGVFDEGNGTTTLMNVDSSGLQSWCGGSQGCGYDLDVSADGRFVVFDSWADDLTDKECSCDIDDVYLHDRDVSGDGHFDEPGDIATTILTYVEGYDEELIACGGDRPSISGSGMHISFETSSPFPGEDDDEALWSTGDIFVYNLEPPGPTYQLASVTSQGAPATTVYVDVPEPSFVNIDSRISTNGRFVVFLSDADNLDPLQDDNNEAYDVFVHDLLTGNTRRVSVSTSGQETPWCLNGYPSISGDGRFIVFQSEANNLVPNDTNSHTDIFVHDLDPDESGDFFDVPGVTTRVNLTAEGLEAFAHGVTPSISDDGRLVAFVGLLGGYIPGCSLNRDAIFVHDRDTDEDGVFDEPGGRATYLVSQGIGGAMPDHHSGSPFLSNDGGYVAYWSDASNLVAGDTNGVTDVFVSVVHPRLIQVVSRKSHGSEGDFDIDLPLEPQNAAVECRTNDTEPLHLRWRFNEPVAAAAPPIQQDVEVTLSHGTLQSATIEGNELVLLITGVQNESCLQVVLEGFQDSRGIPLAGDKDLHIRLLVGDVNSSGNVNIFDLVTLRDRLDQQVSSDTFRNDLNSDGAINIFDLVTARDYLNTAAASCE